jgi:long-subunit acyl-CoA synthetase (AMP-forming)
MATFTTIPHDKYELPGGKVVDLAMLDTEMRQICHYIGQVIFCLKDGAHVVAVIFPDDDLLKKPDYAKSPEEGCFCPRNVKELGKCPCGCTCTVNSHLPTGYARIEKALIIHTHLAVEDGTMAPNGLPLPEQILKKYQAHLQNLYGRETPVEEEVFVMNFTE